ncbi:MAG: heme-binding protein [Gammaproteobacteria bacterium]|nr:heme-binding protein [Gammaproteobacteria bacterium]
MTAGSAGPGPQRSPLGLSADPGGFPLYKNETLVGGVGVMADGDYTIDANILDFDRDVDEMIALAATFGFTPNDDIRSSRITVEGKTLRFSDVSFRQLPADPAAAPAFSTLGSGDGALIPVPGYTDGTIRKGTVFGQPESGVRSAEDGAFPGRDAFVFVDAADTNRYSPRAGTDDSALTAEEVRVILDEALGVANQARAQIRRPLGSQARVTVAVVDSNGAVLGMARNRDAPIFGADVSLQKARTAAFVSSPGAAEFLNAVTEPTVYLDADLNPRRLVEIPDYVTAAKNVIGPGALSDGTAFSDRAGGNLSRPFFPDGLVGREHGPFSKPAGEWSVFSTGMQLDLVMNGVVQHVGFAAGSLPMTLRTIVSASNWEKGSRRRRVPILPTAFRSFRAACRSIAARNSSAVSACPETGSTRTT